MSAVTPMSGLRRRAMPGMPSRPVSAAATDVAHDATVQAPPTPAAPELTAAVSPQRGRAAGGGKSRWRAEDYSATRLANFRLPVDLHDRYRRLVTDVERDHPRLRHPSLTEVIVALLEEGPDTPDGVAELIRRKRVDEHAAEATR
jgi:hypothetical protein